MKIIISSFTLLQILIIYVSYINHKNVILLAASFVKKLWNNTGFFQKIQICREEHSGALVDSNLAYAREYLRSYIILGIFIPSSEVISLKMKNTLIYWIEAWIYIRSVIIIKTFQNYHGGPFLFHSKYMLTQKKMYRFTADIHLLLRFR